MKSKEVLNETKNKKKILKSGFIPYFKNNKNTEILLMVPSDPNFGGDKPQFAKGEIEKDLSPLENALKEAEEELGLIVDNVLFADFLCKKKNIFWFYGEIKNKNLKPFSFETKEVVWCNMYDAKNIIRKDQISILEKFINKIEKNIKNHI